MKDLETQASNPLRRATSTMDDDGGVLYDLACGCEALFDTQLANLTAQESPLVDLVAEYQQRFAIWAAHLGVFARKSQSLDTRLRNHADIQDLVARLLAILRRSLHQLMRAIEASGENDPSRVGDDTPRDTALSAIGATLTRLNRLGVAIRQSSRERIDVKVQRFAATIDFGPFAAVSQAVVQQLYPNAHQSLRQYLAKTMVDRYTSMLYKKFREGKLQPRRPEKSLGSMPTIDEGPQINPDRNPPGLLADNGSQQMLSGTLSSTTISGITPATSRSGPSTINSKQLRSILYRTNHFQVPTERRKGTSSVQVGRGNYPRPPSQEGSNFIACEWCSRIIEKREMSESDWRRHIDEDLKPYTCISDACSDGHPAFSGFAPWLSHMKEHNRRWHQRVFPTSSWICAVCDDSPDIHTSPEALHEHMVQAHGDMFPTCQLQAIARQSKVERQRPWNECLLCCFPVDKTEPPPKRRKEQLVNEADNKSRRTSFATKHPEPEREDEQDSDASDDYLDVSGLALTAGNAETMARHIASHLQALMLLTIRLALLSDDHSQETQDHANSASVDPGDSGEASSTESAQDSAADTVFTENVEMPDADGETLEAADMPQVDHVPDAIVDFDGVPRRYDGLPVEEDEFLQELIESGAYQAEFKRPEPPSGEQPSQEGSIMLRGRPRSILVGKNASRRRLPEPPPAPTQEHFPMDQVSWYRRPSRQPHAIDTRRHAFAPPAARPNDDLLLDLDNDYLPQFHPQGHPPVSYDDFVGAGRQGAFGRSSRPSDFGDGSPHNSVSSLDRDMLSRAQRMFGMRSASGYSEMDLPLTEPGGQQTAGPSGDQQQQQQQKPAKGFRASFLKLFSRERE
ncbi:hypothetical protein MAPG_06685 [Magnaporthiopsis poae ATCC 64411]|uniref:Uncharacterized protein n=1 Tax=Magnaporthiopsis poae (strain ATCC 64411 / 73-15) TaxID=644358 RepID=A0A0C4E2P5_MAGP6|nr:hypothetical protein MAPG_06685 [Magnaporthiopsis poae ATCC 64411]